MRLKVKHHHTGKKHHIGTKHGHKGHKSHTAHHHTGTGRQTGNRATTGLTGQAILSALHGDASALAALSADVASVLFSGGFAAEIIAAIEAVVGSSQTAGPGRKIAGTISTGTGALELNGSSQAYIAMVFLNGAATAVACYVPTHIRSQIATGQEVWVEPMNGSMNDLMIVALRNIF